MQSYVDRKKIAGLSTIIARKGKVIHCEQVGQMDIESGKPMSADAIFRLYSMTKPIVCVALMILYEQGKFHLADPIHLFNRVMRLMELPQERNSMQEVMDTPLDKINQEED